MGMYAKWLIIVVLFVAAVWWLHEPYQEYRKARTEVRRIETRLLEVREQNERLREAIHALKTDPRAIERLAREKFGYCRPNETIYDFSAPMSP